MKDVYYVDNEEPCVLVVGNIVDGTFIEGPFEGRDNAIAHANTHYKNENWIVTELHNPEER